MADTEKAGIEPGNGTHQHNEEFLAQDHPPHHGMSTGQYLATRFSSLKPPMTKSPNPIALLRTISGRQWAFFAVAFFAWTWDAFDFFTVSLTVTDLAETFGKTNTDITWGITLVLMFRSVGSIAFGIAADRYGRKWPFVVNNILFIILELVSLVTRLWSSFSCVGENPQSRYTVLSPSRLKLWVKLLAPQASSLPMCEAKPPCDMPTSAARLDLLGTSTW